MHLKAIYTETEDCKDCYKCIRQCPTKAIKVNNNLASVVDDLCIYCGHCVIACPTGAKKVRDGISQAKQLLEQKHQVYVSLAPAFIAEYGQEANIVIQKLHALGFAGVSETALGAQEVSTQVGQYLHGRENGVYISSACPSVVELVRKYYPQHTMAITPFLSPMLAHAKMLRKWYGNAIGVVFIGPCIAKKAEADGAPNLVDVALTFKELNQWLNNETISTTNENHKLVPHQAAAGALYPLGGGMINTIDKDARSQFMSFTGQNMVRSVLDDLDNLGKESPLFLELLACEEGCINGPGVDCTNGIATKLQAIKSNFETKNEETHPQNTNINIERDFFNIIPNETRTYQSEDIKDALFSIGKKTAMDELNCGGCGYDTCREFTKALLSNHAETDMCVSYMRMVAHDKATILLQKIPSGVVIIDNTQKVLEMNAAFARLLGEEMELCFEVNKGLKGFDMSEMGEFASYFETALLTGKEYHEIPIQEKGRNYQLSIFNIQKNRLVAGILQSPRQTEFRHDIIEKRTREVIQKNMETVQKIAFLLGENASFTDSLLNSILDEHQH